VNRRRMRLAVLLLVAGAGVLGAAPRPNIIFILCDDLGFGATGPTYQNERAALHDRAVPFFTTPALDRFAAEGLQLRNHYSAAPICAPSRASLLLGVTQGHANIRDNQFDKALANNHTIATVLRRAGYATAAIGKWGLQGGVGGKKAGDEDAAGGESARETPADWPGYPTKRGFDFYFGYVRHVDGHFHYPREDGREVWENEREVSVEIAGGYTTDLFTARAKHWIVEQRRARPDQPFMLYLALDTPHAVLAYPPADYPAGGGLRGGVQWRRGPAGIANPVPGPKDSWCDPAVAEATWDHDRDPGTPEVAWPDVQKRSATAVRRIDRAVGDLLQLLRDLAIDENTLVVFTSDNGPTPESYLGRNPNDPGFFGTAGPFSGIKRDTLEGGIRVPALVRWPAQIAPGRLSRTPSGQWDWLATFAEAAGVPVPAASDGVSLLPTLTGRGEQRPSSIYFEYFHQRKAPVSPRFAPAHRGRTRQQMQTVQLGRYTGVRYDIRSAEDDFEIYAVEEDLPQADNLAGRPELASVQAELKAAISWRRRPESSAPRPYDSMLVAPVKTVPDTAGRLWRQVYPGDWAWVPDFQGYAPASAGLVVAIDATAVPAGGGGQAFAGFFHAERAGDYTFHVSSDSGAVLLLHQARVIDDDFARPGHEASGTIRLAAGWHPLRLYSRHAAGTPRLALTYQEGGGPRAILTGGAMAVSRLP
jgi:arylsulfatase A-like enzyme